MEAHTLPVVSPSLIYRGDYSEPAPEGFKRIFMHLFDAPDKLHLNDYDAKIDEFEDELLIQASQMYENQRQKMMKKRLINCCLKHHKKWRSW